ncbi:MAG TPA: capsule assembly Wzi family protein [Candidatus Binataceae bacterium]|nr:capsule assembly Wzi family protein [Candidatus Binataceae bacterium]
MTLLCVTSLSLGVLDRQVWASTYVVYIPLDSPIYQELDTLNGLGWLDTYLNEIRPISRVEAARLTIEAEKNLANSDQTDALAASLIHSLHRELPQEIQWLVTNNEDNLPTMVQPFERAEAQLIFSRGEQRLWRTSAIGIKGEKGLNAQEGTPLLPNNDGIPTAPGTNEVFRWAGWAGFGSFLTAYGEGAAAGPLTRSINIDHGDRLRPLGTAVVASLGNFALSAGDEEMWWGAGHFSALMFIDNAAPFPALRVQNIHPKLLPGFFRYLGQCRYQLFFGRLDDDRYYAHPWIDGQILSFKPLPTFEIGFTHAILFGGAHNHNYGVSGFLGRATGFATGNASDGNTHSRGGLYVKFRFPSLRNLEIYQELVGNDNLTYEVPTLGHFLPFLSVSYQGGFYLPRLTADGLTELRFEYAILEPNDQTHSDSLYWAYNGKVMGDALGPNATQINLAVDRWITLQDRVGLGWHYTERVPGWGSDEQYLSSIYGTNLTKEHAAGIDLDFLHLDTAIHRDGLLARLQAQLAVEYVDAINYQPHNQGVRLMLSCEVSLSSDFTVKFH